MSEEAHSEQEGKPPQGETVPSPLDSDACPTDLPPDTFTGYRLVGEISTGGQSVVYKAIQKSTKRKVAIKVMKEGPFADSADRARFDREIQVLGQLNHPSVVTIHETGISAGCHYFVMDYISGESLDVYIEKARLSIKETLALFVKICDAVNAAHLHGVIHRDLKPSNIRVDADGEPHMLDFGLAKVATSDSSSSLVTMTGQFIGSLPWASPEQAEAIPGKIDLRTDVYSLGVILYQMLTGRFPYEVAGNIRDVLDNIMKTEPARPSTTRKQIDNELDTIVVKCLAKGRERRYQTAGELGRDIEHYLKGEPIEAKRDSVGYVLRKHLARYRFAFGIGAAFIVLIVAALATTFHLWREAERQREIADAALEFLETDFFNPIGRAARDTVMTPEDVVDLASEGISERFVNAPRVELRLRNLLGQIYLRMLRAPAKAGLHFERALELNRREFGSHHLKVSEALWNLSDARYRQMDRDSAAALCREAVAVQREAHNGDHPDVASVMIESASRMRRYDDFGDAESLCRGGLAMWQRLRGGDSEEATESLRLLASILRSEGQLKSAEGLYRELLERSMNQQGRDAPADADAMVSLGGLLIAMGDSTGAEAMYREAIASVRKTGIPDSTSLMNASEALGRLYYEQRRYADAVRRYRDALVLSRKVHGEDHGRTSSLRADLAGCAVLQGRYDEAATLYRKNLDLASKKHREEYSETRVWRLSLLWTLLMHGDHNQAADLLRGTLAQYANGLAGDRFGGVRMSGNLALELLQHGRYDLAERTFGQALDLAREISGEENEMTMDMREEWADLLWVYGRYDLAEGRYHDALALSRRVRGEANERTVNLRSGLALALTIQGRFGEAERLYRENLAVARGESPPDRRSVAQRLFLLGENLVRQGEYSEAESCLRERLAVEGEDADEFERYRSMSLLAHLLTERGHFAEAETLALRSFEGMLEVYPSVSATEPLELLTTLFSTRGSPELAVPYLEMYVKDALDRRGDHNYLNGASWLIARTRDLSSDMYRLALEAATRANALSPASYMILNTLGVAQYRTGQYEEALTTLRRCEQLSPDHPADVAFIGMTLFQLGQEKEAEVELYRLEQLMEQPGYARDKELQAFLVEARDLVQTTQQH